jgi:bacterioferritin-associated ferredoxin
VLVCHCRRVSDTQICSAVDAGHVDARAVVRATAAGTGCGSCVNHLREVIERALAPSPVPAA